MQRQTRECSKRILLRQGIASLLTFTPDSRTLVARGFHEIIRWTSD